MAKPYLATTVDPISRFCLAVAIIVRGYEVGYVVFKILIFTISPRPKDNVSA